MGTSAVPPRASLWLKLNQISFPLCTGTTCLGPARPVSFFFLMAGLPEYAGHLEEVPWKVDRQSEQRALG